MIQATRKHVHTDINDKRSVKKEEMQQEKNHIK